MHLVCGFAAMALWCGSTALHCRVCLRVAGVVRAAPREVAALLHCTPSSACVILLALLGGARSLSQPGMSKRVRFALFVFAGSSYHARFVLAGQAELAACNTLAHPQIASTRSIRPRLMYRMRYISETQVQL